eukprot:1195696-Prorocentrum_minimum.AAC.4
MYNVVDYRLLQYGRVLITNPDMLHCSLLPHHRFDAGVQRVLKHLRVIVLDEAHAYRGVFGSHASLILRSSKPLDPVAPAGGAAAQGARLPGGVRLSSLPDPPQVTLTLTLTLTLQL